MGIAKGMARLLLEESKVRPFAGSILEFGRQTIILSPKELDHWAKIHDISLSQAKKDSLAQAQTDSVGRIDDVTFFSSLGFDSVESLDVFDHEKPTYLLDLNQPVPESLHGKFDVIFDGGTIEHIFDQAAVFRNIFHLLKIGGRIIHGSPSTNHIDHGFYMYSPLLFHEYYSANRYDLVTSYVFEYDNGKHTSTPWSIYEYSPGSIAECRPFKNALGIFFVAQKTAQSTADVIPQQSNCKNLWVAHTESVSWDSLMESDHKLASTIPIGRRLTASKLQRNFATFKKKLNERFPRQMIFLGAVLGRKGRMPPLVARL